ncbi:MAG: hypothetical protein ACR2QV_02695 [Gammaproteobacteria bacterium]
MFNNKFHRLRMLTVAGGIMLASPASAGPPLNIDDPGILDPGQWEVIVASSSAKEKGGGTASELPVLDVSLGLSDNTQISAAYPYVVVDPEGASSESDFGNLAVGFKWRFYNSENLQIAFAPGYSFGISLTAATLGVGSDTPITLLPVNLEYALGNWTLSAELAFAAIQQEEDEVAFGGAIGHPLGDRIQLMFEIYGATNSELDDAFVNWNLGADIEITPSWHVLAAFGSRISEPTGAAELDYTAYLGIQYFTGM